MYILVLNSGSSSLKFQIFKQTGAKLLPLIRGLADAIALPNSYIEFNNGQHTYHYKATLKHHASSLNQILDLIKKKGFITDLDELKLIGHRVVHGGEKYREAALVTPTVLKDIKNLCRLAPLHNPPALHCLLACQKRYPNVKQVVVFDTAFHQTLDPLAYLYALPPDLYEKYQIRKYGFHGINCQFVNSEATKLLKKAGRPAARQIICHLGNGCSVTAIKNGKSVETSMGFTPLEGLIMGTRCGDIDPALLLEISKLFHLSLPAVTEFLNKKTGLWGLTGISSDMRTIYQASKKGHKKALLAMAMFSYRLAKYINSYIGVLGGLDALIFTAGIGEHAWYIRSQVIQYLKHLGIKINSAKNLNNKTFFQHSSSTASLMIIPANEELEIVQQSLKLNKNSLSK